MNNRPDRSVARDRLAYEAEIAALDAEYDEYDEYDDDDDADDDDENFCPLCSNPRCMGYCS